MGAIEPQLEEIRTRLSQLLSTHLSQLNTDTCVHATGEIVIKQGAPAERLFLVRSGVLAVEVVEAGKPARVLALVRTGEILGEMGLFGDHCHSAQVRVENGPATLLAARSDDLLKALLFDSELALEMLALSSARCRQANHNQTLLLDAIQALSDGSPDDLEQCCQAMNRGSASLSRAAAQLSRLHPHQAQRTHQGDTKT
ncbi:cyclic nucleotide-binding domain-containing protein [Synechococcus sp. RS9916]|uniref:cyclic nucleotide-binding domain-containing protein n=1 Tax=Synechococcus sp. RS9916 TaxID=221359 RepID=UPI0000E53582|nr:cyclic nucleotide-binding domain-containing protein [Synechococcus sp. RS9916]EAU75154.1 Cyclic nucleotide-binding domain [Synechococcus sp. RS9916]